ncbi:hypothetical protein QIH87_14205 [Bradyrhizobium elkanii]|uniref:hypothetical protein n=1 Tax=Bradyrhizobium elkanii TaxID=29448 RepID=UPI00102105CE|nr:hypothetical protein [Bradyrhizobium elkanii]MCW2112489.1 hypothetical protein [Bradyrhizobium elkanii]MCW2199154.1 hypothetical protein [Bradyrhizobium elkanii]MCW2229293.1 hypothetical protein [Bradyrhizobium elkanii]NWL38099.1 hypothetical protein [Bradyrhizobium elkanii]RYM15737.1 hypothetical protein EWH13_38510 [Bradyrhizobium elkanii]
MTEIRIDENKASRMIAQMLRDDFKLRPDEANKAAQAICTLLVAAMGTPTHQPLQGMRLIRSIPPHGGDFTEAVALKLADVNDRVARELWRLVYDRATDLPPGVADAVKY